MKQTRLVLIDIKKNTYSVFENRVMLAMYNSEAGHIPTKGEIEEIRVAEYKTKA